MSWSAPESSLHRRRRSTSASCRNTLFARPSRTQKGRRMSLHVFIAHTGKRLEADPVNFNSLDALRSWIHTSTHIPPQDQVFLTARGKNVKLQTLLTEREIFVYDRDLFALPTPQNLDAVVPPTALPEHFTPTDPPDILKSHTDLKSWQSLFKARREWALDLVAQCRSMSDRAQQVFNEQSTINRGVRIATGNHEAHIKSLEQTQADARAWVEGIAKEQEDSLQSWETDLVRLSKIPASEQFRRFTSTPDDTPRKQSKKSGGNRTTLDTFVDSEKAKQAASMVTSVLDELWGRVAEMDANIEKITLDYGELLNVVGQSSSQSSHDYSQEPINLLEEVEVVAKKVISDYEHVRSLPSNPKSVASVSKMALLHTRNHLPTLVEYAHEMNDLERRAVEQRNFTVRSAIEHMQTIAVIEGSITAANAAFPNIDIPAESQDAIDALLAISKMPYIYGIILLEAVRRTEWADKMRKDSAALAEEIAGYREEEDRRRKRWLKNNAGVINTDATKGSILGIEINVQGQDEAWPNVGRQDFQDYMSALGNVGGFEPIVEELMKALKDLDRPTRQQIKHAKGFKNGSLHEAALGKGSLMLRGEDEVRVLRESMIKTEEELKSSKSRVRKLEDLLHRQSHISRLSIASGGGPPTSQTPDTPIVENYQSAPSPRPQENLSRQSSVSSRRYSANKSTEEKNLAKRIVTLETELTAEKERCAGLEKEASARHDAVNNLQRHVEERVSTNKDLMENIDSMQKDWAEERRALEAENRRLRYKNEELEEELERNLGSRDNEREHHDIKRQSLEAELEQIRRDAAEESQRYKERADVDQRAIQDMEQAIQDRDAARAEMNETLLNAYAALAEDEAPPENSDMLATELEKLAQRTKNYAQELIEALDDARADNEATHAGAARERDELEETIRSHAAEISKLQGEHAVEAARAKSLSEELEEERGHLEHLRAKFAEGETGAEALRQRVAEEEAKVERFTVELSEARAHTTKLKSDLSGLKQKHDALENANNHDSSRSEQQLMRAKELSEKLLAHNDRLHRLLETLGFAITHQNGQMVIQRASKVAGSSTMLLGDAAEAMKRSIPSAPSAKRPLESSTELNALKWTQQDNAEEAAAKYVEFINVIDRFDVETFSEAITKRMRDMEHTARKWQREARTYRDKSHRYQSEAHEKIAIRGFKEGDLALFLPTRNQATRPWAAFNVGAPHYFLHEQESHRLQNKEWLVARITKVEERVVDLSKSMDGTRGSDGRSLGDASSGISYEDDNPFELSDGLRWHLVEAAEEKVGAPLTPGLGKSTVHSTNVDARGSIRMKKSLIGNDASKTLLNKSLDSRRNSATSRRSVPSGSATRGSSGTPETPTAEGVGGDGRMREDSRSSSLRPLPGAAVMTEQPDQHAEEGEESHAVVHTSAGAGFTSPPAAAASADAMSLPGTMALTSPQSTIRAAQQALAFAAAVGSPSPRRQPAAYSPVAGPAEGEAEDGASPSRSRRPMSGLFDSLLQLDFSYERGRGGGGR